VNVVAVRTYVILQQHNTMNGQSPNINTNTKYYFERTYDIITETMLLSPFHSTIWWKYCSSCTFLTCTFNMGIPSRHLRFGSKIHLKQCSRNNADQTKYSIQQTYKAQIMKKQIFITLLHRKNDALWISLEKWLLHQITCIDWQPLAFSPTSFLRTRKTTSNIYLQEIDTTDQKT